MAKPIGFQYKQDGSIILIAPVDGKTQLVTIDKTAINYDLVSKALKNGEWEAIPKLLNIRKAVADFSDGRVEIFGDEIFVDKQPVHNAIAGRVLAALRNNLNITPVCRFLENVAANPSQSSRDELYLFLEHNSLPITPDGYILAYKLVRDDYLDIHSGTVDNSIGAKPEMDRSEVDPNRYNTCSSGLHFCSFDYLPQAYSMGKNKRLMVVKINPADVVSIPSDYNNAKGRTWTYEVVDELPHFEDSLPKNYTDKYGPVSVNEEEDEEESEEYEYSSYSSYDEDEDEEEEELPASQMTGAKIDADDVREIRVMLKDGWTLRAIADTFDISPRQVARIRDGESWSHIK